MKPALARDSWFARRKPGHVVRRLITLAVLGTVLATVPAQAQPSAVEPPPATVGAPAAPASALPSAAAAPAPANPALDVSAPGSAAPPERSIFGRWWFWTAVGAAAAATVAVIVLSSGGHAPPATDLGNQEFQP